MFDIGWSELVVIGIVALIAIGPKELPGVLRGLGHWMGKVRRMAAEFQDQFREAMREAEVADLKKQFDDMQASASNVASGFDNPLDTARREMEKAFEDKPLSAPDAPAAATASDDTGSVVPAPVPLGIAADAPQSDMAQPDATATAEAKREGSGAA
jgi:sec-independent protein translocase protein TatB